MSLAAWYSSQYSAWNRTRRLQQPQFLARTDTNTSRVAAAMAQNTAQTNGAETAISNPNRDKKASDPLFGPNIGPCSAGPAWTTAASRKKLITDDLTPEVLTSWVEKSKQSSQPTTTLQALVNLKRPTLRLSPLSAAPEDAEPLHGLEFEYDCDAPKCGVYVHVVLSKNHPEASSVPSASNQAQILVFESVTSGGFGKRLTLEEGALLELGRFDHITPASSTRPVPPPDSSADIPKSDSTTELPAATASSDPPSTNRATNNHRRRFTQFHFRKRDSNRSVSGPALAVVDADPQPATVQGDNSNSAGSTKKEKDKEDEGVRVIIRLAALDEQGTELASPNEQTTFLHIVRLGTAPATAEDSETEDHRPWVVKVVKREATIGPHTFQLHEIYGLTSAANVTPSSNTSPNPSTTNNNNSDAAHTYPPTQQPITVAEEEDPSSECLLCLSSPREVVLIPCRHLVACKECALNMVEFGAGGNITHNTEPTVPTPAVTAPGGGAGNDTGDTASGLGGDGTNGNSNSNSNSNTGGNGGPTIPTVTLTARRKRKAKGWFCPVCRQPYTSLLRISTAAPPLGPNDKDGLLSNDEHRTSGIANGITPITEITNQRNNSNPNETEVTGNSTTSSGGGILGSAFVRPSFLRGLSLPGRNSNGAAIANGLQNDVESQAGLGRVGA